MPIGIVQVMNNTSRALHYKNNESGHKIDIDPKTDQYEDEGLIPSSNFYDDTVPYKSSDHIDVWLGDDGTKVKIADDNWRFYINGPVDYTSERSELWRGSLDNGGQYILRVDEVNDGGYTYAAITIYKYEDKYNVSASYIALQLIQQAGPVVALVLMAIFL